MQWKSRRVGFLLSAGWIANMMAVRIPDLAASFRLTEVSHRPGMFPKYRPLFFYTKHRWIQCNEDGRHMKQRRKKIKKIHVYF
jgi:hypothetical protein